MSQTEDILEYLKKHGSITPVDAFVDLGCMRLAARISDLRCTHNITSEIESHISAKTGKTVRYARYRLEE